MNDQQIMKPWWKQLWPWLLISGPALAMVACVITIYLAINLLSLIQISDEGIYTIGFFMIWIFCAFSSALTAYILPGIASSDNKEIDRGLI